jgi:phenylacetate-CoA ligase
MYSQLYKTIIFPLYCRYLKKNKVNKEYTEATTRLSLSLTQLEQFQWQRLEKLLSFCWVNVPYYRKKWLDAGITDISDIKNLTDFAQLPVLTKNDVNEHFDDLIPEKFKGSNIRKSTGGSTGQPFHFELDNHSNDTRQAIMWRGYGWLGAGLGIKTLFLWGDNIGKLSFFRNLKEKLYHRFYNREMVSTFSMNSNNLDIYVDKINAYKPEAIVSYVNPLYEIAKYINANNISVFSPKSMLTGAEPLYDFQRIEIEKAFNSKVYNTFGCREFMLIAAECEKQQGLHINIDHLVVETTNEQGSSVIGEPGDLIITDLMNYGMPLIRYVNGDQATLTETPCGCSNPLPMIEKINGRKLDVIRTKTGQMIPGELFPHLLKEFKGINKFQVKQTQLEAITIFIIKNKHFIDEQMLAMNQEIERYSKGSLQINYEFVDDIPLTKSGKHRVTVSELS